MASFFISDIHLGNGINEEKKRNLLYLFFEHVIAEKGEQLFFGGDTFDFWFEYKNQFIPERYKDFFAQLKKLRSAGVELFFIGGNHDYWLGKTFTKYLQSKVFLDDTIITVQGNKIYWTHGDGKGKGDYGYKLLKLILRNRLCIFLFSLIPSGAAYSIADFVSAQSRKKNRRYQKFNVPEPLKKIPEYAKIQDPQFNIYIRGHSHSPVLINEKDIIYADTGDWQKEFTFVEIDSKSVSLKKFSKEDIKTLNSINL